MTHERLLSPLPSEYADPVRLREAQLVALYTDPSVPAVVARRFSWRLQRVRRDMGGRFALPDEDFAVMCQTAVTQGYYRALLDRFMAERGFDGAWLSEQRACSIRARDAQDRSSDYLIVADLLPEIGRFYPASPLTEDEVIDAALLELYDRVCARGSRHHAEINNENFRRRTRRQDPSIAAALGGGGLVVRATTDYGLGIRAEDVEFDFLDPDAEERVADPEGSRIRDSADDPFGPAITYVANRFIERYGPTLTVLWVAEHVYYDGRYTQLVRDYIGTEEMLGPLGFDAVRRDLERKLKRMDAEAKAFASSADVKRLYGVAFGHEPGEQREVAEEARVPALQIAGAEGDGAGQLWIPLSVSTPNSGTVRVSRGRSIHISATRTLPEVSPVTRRERTRDEQICISW